MQAPQNSPPAPSTAARPGTKKTAKPTALVTGKQRAAATRIDARLGPAELWDAAQHCWERVETLGAEHGFRNAQMTVLAPTGTIGLLMDCDTTGVEPDFSLVKWKKLAGGGYMKIVNQSLSLALRHLGYDDEKIAGIIVYMLGTRNLADGGPIALAR